MSLLRPAPYIVQATIQPHTHTVIFLHGRGGNGPEFASDLLELRTSTGLNLAEALPRVCWIFPTATTQQSTVFQEDMTEWFDIYSLTDPSQRSDLQANGLYASVRYIRELLQSIGGDPSRIILAGISQGLATALWTLICSGMTLGGLIGASGWMPFAHDLEVGGMEAVEAWLDIGEWKRWEGWRVLQTPVWLGHGSDDAYVDIELGRSARDLLHKMGFDEVEWKEYTGAEEEGHWLKEPEELDDILKFLIGIVDSI
ncbi:lysophospholipase/carboxylesterase family protein [Geopyxis carbonaria]|nr:lysophospholipase/carboxylesterase family protein [Geopyxis carbonaria]